MQKKVYDLRVAGAEDIPAIKNIFIAARRFMASQGNPQWQSGYPFDDVIEEGVTGGHFRVLETEGIVAAVWSVYDHDDEYDEIDGTWLTDKFGKNVKYLAAHTLAVAEGFRGMGFARSAVNAAVQEAERDGKLSVRIDTHIRNLPMQNLLSSLGFSFCGAIIARGEGNFLCYEKIL